MTLRVSLRPREPEAEIAALPGPALTEALATRVDQVAFEGRRRVPPLPKGHGSSRRLRVGSRRHPPERSGEGGAQQGGAPRQGRAATKPRTVPPVIFMISEPAT